MSIIFLMSAAVAVMAPACAQLLHGGPADGMCLSRLAKAGERMAVIELLPAQGPRPALAPDIAKVVDGLLAAHDRVEAISRKLIVDGGTQEYCLEMSAACFEKHGLETWLVGPAYVHSSPYLLSDGRIRIEWLMEGQLKLLSWVRLDGDQVRDIQTGPAIMPVMGTR